VLNGTVSFDPPSISSAACTTQTTSVPGVQVGDMVIVNTPSATGMPAHLKVDAQIQPTADVVTFRFCNTSGANLNDTARTYGYIVIR
jgi:hypothetical protein